MVKIYTQYGMACAGFFMLGFHSELPGQKKVLALIIAQWNP